jgi:hypothetical protein
MAVTNAAYKASRDRDNAVETAFPLVTPSSGSLVWQRCFSRCGLAVVGSLHSPLAQPLLPDRPGALRARFGG